MEDLKYTLSTDPSFRSQYIEDEAKWMADQGFLLYPIHIKPVRAEPGCWIYFVRDGQMVGRARIQGFVTTVVSDDLYTFTGEPASKTCWNIKATAMEIAKTPIETEVGFQSFRYLSDEERRSWAEAFSEGSK